MICQQMPLAEQLIQFRIGIGEVLAFHSAVYVKADAEKIPLDAAAAAYSSHSL